MGAEPEQTIRHMTATGFLVWQGRVLLHWHRKNQLWLPFGGHIEANEDPVQCVLREVEEECGVAVELFGYQTPYALTDLLQLPPPMTILIEPVTDGTTRHEHIDLIYFCRPKGTAPPELSADPTFRWVSAAELETNAPVAPYPGAEAAAIPDNVRVPALDAIARSLDGTHPADR